MSSYIIPIKSRIPHGTLKLDRVIGHSKHEVKLDIEVLIFLGIFQQKQIFIFNNSFLEKKIIDFINFVKFDLLQRPVVFDRYKN